MKIALPLAQPPESICILRLSALGDVCNLLPVVRTLQAHWPQTRLTWVVGRLEYQLVREIEGVEFIVFDKRGGMQSIIELRRRFIGRGFTVLLQMQAALRASAVALNVPAGIRMGFNRRQAKDFQWLFTGAKTRPLHHPHVVDAFFAFLQRLGIQRRELRWDLPISAAGRRRAQQLIPRARDRLLVISPCASARFRNWRNWRVARYAQLIDHAAQRHGLQTVLTGGGSREERDYGQAIARQAQSPVLDLIGQTDVQTLLAVIARADAVVAPDSGPVHLANALGVTPIGLYAGSNPERTGPYCYRKWVVNAYPEAVARTFGKTIDQIPWGARVRRSDVLDLISVQAVMAKLDQLFIMNA